MKDAKACLKCGHDRIWRVDPTCFFDPAGRLRKGENGSRVSRSGQKKKDAT